MNARRPWQVLGLCAAAQAAAWVLLSPPPAGADIVTFTTGRTKEVIILEETETSVKVESPTGVITIPRANIDTINRMSPEENRALRRKWGDLERRKLRAREEAARRQAEEEAREARQTRDTVVVDGERVSRTVAARRAQEEANESVANSLRIDAYRKKLEEQGAEAKPIDVTGLRLEVPEPGLVTVSGAVMNLSAQTYESISVEVQLVANVGQENENVVMSDLVYVPQLTPSSLHDFRVDMPATEPEALRLRAVVTDARAVGP